jgi:hypothetical protein
MKTQRLFVALTVINLGLTIFLLTRASRVEADNVAPVLRGRSLEIVDDQGRVRASIKLHPAEPNYKWPDGKIGIPETVMLRLIDGKGRPEVKIGASEQGGGLGLIGEYDTAHVILQAQGADSSLKLANKDGRQQFIKP